MSSWPQIARRIRVPLGFALAAVFLWLAQPNALFLAIGAVLELAGLFVRAIASGHVKKNEVLTTTGPYAYVRNPLYLGSLLLAGGFSLAARSWWIGTLFIVLFVVVYLPVIQGEEEFLRKQFPDFDEYSRQVSRFIPRFRAYRDTPSSFSWNLYWKHQEYNAILGTALMNAALMAKMIWVQR